jgi:hypothetical protein
MSIFDTLKKKLMEDIDNIVKTDTVSDVEVLEKSNKEDIIGKAILTDPYFDRVASTFSITKNRPTRLTNRTLRDISVKDWLVNTILQIRCDTLLRFSRRQERRFEMGFRVIMKNPAEKVTEQDKKNMFDIEEYILKCGRTDSVPIGQEMSFGEFLKLTTWDALSIGYIGVEKINTMGGALHRFRPLPAETLYRVDPFVSKSQIEQQIKQAEVTYRKPKSDNDPNYDGEYYAQPVEYWKYVQTATDGRILTVFGDNEMVFKLFNPKNFADSNGYSISMVEQAVSMITNHMNVESYNQNFFTHGHAAKGILHLKGTVTQNSLASFRRQFYNTISGSNNAWRTPIVAGLDDVQWVPMSVSAKEMEYINYNSHIMRCICAQFQIDPLELGLDYLTSANGRASAAAKESGQFKITYSRERGLIPILMFFEDFINNDILPALDPTFASRYVFKFFGYTDETAQTEVSLRQAQMSTFASMNDLLRWEEKPQLDMDIANMPLNQGFIALMEKNMTRGEIREHLLGDKDASKRPELQYIPGDPLFVQWQQMLMQKAQMKMQIDQQQQAGQQQQAQQDQQNALAEKEHQREQEKHDLEVAQLRGQHARLAIEGGKSPLDTMRDKEEK